MVLSSQTTDCRYLSSHLLYLLLSLKPQTDYGTYADVAPYGIHETSFTSFCSKVHALDSDIAVGIASAPHRIYTLFLISIVIDIESKRHFEPLISLEDPEFESESAAETACQHYLKDLTPHFESLFSTFHLKEKKTLLLLQRIFFPLLLLDKQFFYPTTTTEDFTFTTEDHLPLLLPLQPPPQLK